MCSQWWNSEESSCFVLLKTSEKHKLPLSSLEDLMLDVRQLIDTVLNQVEAKSMESLSASDALSLQAILHDETVVNPFTGLHSTYQQTKYFKDYLGLVVSYAASTSLHYTF